VLDCTVCVLLNLGPHPLPIVLQHQPANLRVTNAWFSP
jgi:hypothetical protein